MNYKIVLSDNFDPRGRDGKGWNRMVMGCGNMTTPVTRCMLKPKSWQAAWELHNRLLLASATQYGVCSGDQCSSCPVANKERVNYKCGAELAVVRENDTDGSVWILNRRDRGWGEFGYRYNDWADFVQSENLFLGSRKSDEHGAYFEVVTA